MSAASEADAAVGRGHHLRAAAVIGGGCWHRQGSLKGALAWSDGSSGCDGRESAQAQSGSTKGTTYYYYCRTCDDPIRQRLGDESVVNSIRSVAAAVGVRPHRAANDITSL